MGCGCAVHDEREQQWTAACVALVCPRAARVDAAGRVRVKGQRRRGWARRMRVWVRRDGRVLALGRLWRGTPMWMRPAVVVKAGAVGEPVEALGAMPGCGCDDGIKQAAEWVGRKMRGWPVVAAVACCLTLGAVGLATAPRPHAEPKTGVGGQTRGMLTETTTPP